MVLVGASAAVGRPTFPADLGSRMEPYRVRLLDAIGVQDPNQRERMSEIARFDSPFAAHPAQTLLHVIPGALFLVLAPLQFASRIRTRHLRLHRWSGRLLVLAGLLSGLNGLYFGLLMPFAGAAERVAIALFGGLFLLALARGFVAIRRRDPDGHREWMIRAFAIALGISTVRVLGGILDVALTPSGVAPVTVFLLSVWLGWSLTLGAAEVWIRRTRPRAVPGAALAEA
jgi:hypothetical protein